MATIGLVSALAISTLAINRKLTEKDFDKLAQPVPRLIESTSLDETVLSTGEERTEEEKARENINKNAQHLEDYFQDFSRIYVQEISESSMDYKESIESQGLDAVAETFASTELLTLDYAVMYPNAGEGSEELLEQVVDSYFQSIVNNAVYSYRVVDYDLAEPEAKRAIRDFVIAKIEYNRSILDAEGNSFQELVRATYTKEEHERVFGELLRLGGGIYDSIRVFKFASNPFGAADSKITEIINLNAEIYNRERHEAIFSE